MSQRRAHVPLFIDVLVSEPYQRLCIQIPDNDEAVVFPGRGPRPEVPNIYPVPRPDRPEIYGPPPIPERERIPDYIPEQTPIQPPPHGIPLPTTSVWLKHSCQ